MIWQCSGSNRTSCMLTLYHGATVPSFFIQMFMELLSRQVLYQALLSGTIPTRVCLFEVYVEMSLYYELFYRQWQRKWGDDNSKVKGTSWTHQSFSSSGIGKRFGGWETHGKTSTEELLSTAGWRETGETGFVYHLGSAHRKGLPGSCTKNQLRPTEVALGVPRAGSDVRAVDWAFCASMKQSSMSL